MEESWTQMLLWSHPDLPGKMYWFNPLAAMVAQANQLTNIALQILG